MTDAAPDRDTEASGVDTPDTPLAQQSTVQINRARMQGNGVGQRELNGQQDPDRDVAAGDTAAQE